MYCDERPEWQIEKYRFYVELPGDLYEDGYFMQLVKMNQPLRNADGRRDYTDMLQEGQVTTELVVIDPNDACALHTQLQMLGLSSGASLLERRARAC